MKRALAIVMPLLATVVSWAAIPPAQAVTWPQVSATFSDPAGDTSPQVDLVSVGGAYRGEGVSLSATMVGNEIIDPAAWQDSGTGIIWMLDTTGAGTDTYDVNLFSDGSEPVAWVSRTADDEAVCDAIVDHVGATFTVRFPASCIDTPAAFGLAAAMGDGSGLVGVDLAPDSGWGMGITRTAGRSGYWMLDQNGGVYPFGDASRYGQAGPTPGGFVDLEPAPDGGGYWLLAANGAILSEGDAQPFLGATMSPGEQAASLSTTPTGAGGWIFTDRGRVIAFGDAASYGDMSGTKLNGPILDSVATPSGHGYYMVGSDGGIFAFGDAVFTGSMGGTKLNAPVQSLVPDPDGAGYWLVAADGGVFAFHAGFRGSMGGKPLAKPVTGMVPYGNGYLMVGADGGIFNFSDKPFAGSLGAHPPASPIVSVAVLDES